MAILVRQGDPGVLYFMPSVVFRIIIPFAYVALLWCCAAYVPLKVGMAKFWSAVDILWLLPIFLVAASLVMLRIAFPPHEALASLCVQRDTVRFVPTRVRRKFWAQPSEVMVTAHSREILLCRSYLEQLFDGYSLIVRGIDEPERAIKVDFPFVPSAQDGEQLVNAINVATGLAVRLVTRRRKMDGESQEEPWFPPARGNIVGQGLVVAVSAAVPFVGGALIGYFWPLPVIVVGAGLALWLGQVGVLSVAVHERPPLWVWTTLPRFVAWYAVAVVVGAYIIPGH